MRAIAGYIGAEPEGNVADTISHLSGATDHALINPFTCLHRERIFRYILSRSIHRIFNDTSQLCTVFLITG